MKNKKQNYSNNYKKSPCNFYIKGLCNKGDNCNFSHNIKQGSESICKFAISGSCNKNTCYFSHNLSKYPCKYLNILGVCKKGFNCIFSHEYIKNKDILHEFIQENEKNIVNHINSKIMTPLNKYCLKNNLVNINSQYDILKTDNENQGFDKVKEEQIFIQNQNIIDFNLF